MQLALGRRGRRSALSDLDQLVYASRLIGAETSLVVWGGGNTSVKRRERDYRGREVRRAAGQGQRAPTSRASRRKDFPGVRMDDVLALRERSEMDDQEMVDYLTRALQDPRSPRPSIETLLHGFLPVGAVIHTHADAVVALTNNDRSGQRPARGLRRRRGGAAVPAPGLPASPSR